MKPRVSPAAIGHRSITIGHLANIAIRLGRTSLRWDPVAKMIPDDPAANAVRSLPMRRRYPI